MDDSILKELKERERYLDGWRENFKSAQGALPTLNRILDLTRWQIEVVESRPEEAKEIPLPINLEEIEQENAHLKTVLPSLPYVQNDRFAESTAIFTSGSALAYQYVSRVQELESPNAVNYSNKLITEYHVLQSKQSRREEVQELLAKLGNPQTLDRFARAYRAYEEVKSGTGARTAAAMEMRTFLDGLKGDLWKMARRSFKREKMSWEKMTNRLAKGGPGGLEHELLLKHGERFSSFISRLSDVGKDREGGTLTNLEHIWTEVLEFVYSVMGLVSIDPSLGTNVAHTAV